MFRTARSLLVIAALAVALIALPAYAATAPEPLEQLSVLVTPMGEGTLVQIIARVADGTKAPASVEVVVPNVFEPSGAQLITVDAADNTAAPKVIGKAEPVGREYDAKHTAYSVELDGANAATFTFVAPAGIYSQAANGHATAKLTLPVATDTKVATFSFVLPNGVVAVGDTYEDLGETAEGLKIAGQAFENLKKGDEAKALFAVGASAEAADAAVSEEASATAIQKFLATDNLIVIALIAAIVVISAVAAAIALGRRRAAEALDYDEEYDGYDEAEEADEYEDDEASDADELDDESDETPEDEPTASTGGFFRD